MAQGKTKIKAKLPANTKQKSNKTNKKNSAFTKRKSKLSIVVIDDQALITIYFRCTRAKEDAGKVEDSSGDHKISQPKERRCNEIESY